MAAIVQRRKGITYGKSHRRVPSKTDFYSSAAAGPSAQDEIFDSGLLSHHRHNGPRQDSSQNDMQYKEVATIAKPSGRGRTKALERRVSVSPVIEEDIPGRHSLEKVNGPVKKRKLNAFATLEEIKPFIDHVIPQGNVGTDVEHNTGRQRQLVNKSNDLATREKRGADQRRERQSRLPTQEPVQLRRGPGSEPHAWSRLRTPPLIASSTDARDSNSGSPVSHPSGSPSTDAYGSVSTRACNDKEMREECLVTPPRSNSPIDQACVTPRQKELWGRLLTPNRSSQSPSRLKVSALEIRPTHDDVAQEAHRPRRQQIGKAYKAASRPNRLIDSLSTVAGDEVQASSSSESRTGMRSRSSSASEISLADSGGTARSTPSSGDMYAAQLGEISAPIPPPSRQDGSRQVYNSRGAKVTYAQQRTYLTENSIGPEIGLDESLPNLHQLVPQNISQSAQPQADEFAIDLEQESQAGAMRSARELREAGGNARLLSELEACLDELEGLQNTIASSRSTLLRLAQKLAEPSVARLFVDSGYESRFLRCKIHTKDPVAAALKAIAILLLFGHRSSSALISQADESLAQQFLLESLLFTLDLKTEAREATPKMSKLASQKFEYLCKSTLESRLWQPLSPPFVSRQILSLQSLRYLSNWRQTCGVRGLLCGNDAHLLAQTFFPDCVQGPQANPAQTFCLGHAISVIETSMMGEQCLPDSLLDKGTLQRISCILPYLRSRGNASAMLEDMTLHFYSNLTQSSPAVCDIFAHSEVITPMLEIVVDYFRSITAAKPPNDSSALSKVILALASLINIAEASSLMSQRALSPHESGQPIFDTLVELFVHMRQRATEVYSEDEIDSNVAFGYLSILICCLCLDGETRAQGEKRLPGQSLGPILDASDEFLKYHRAIEAATDNDSPVGGHSGFVDRVQSLIDTLRI